MRPLQEEILKCKALISQLIITNYSQKQYEEKVYEIFDTVFVNYFDTKCPDKIEPQTTYLPEKARKVLNAKYGLGRSEN